MTFKYESYFIFKRMKILPKGKGQEKNKTLQSHCLYHQSWDQMFLKVFPSHQSSSFSLQVHHFLLPDYHSCAALIVSLDYKYSQMLFIFLIIFTMFRTTYIQLFFGDYAKHLPINITFLAHNITLRREYNISGQRYTLRLTFQIVEVNHQLTSLAMSRTIPCSITL